MTLFMLVRHGQTEWNVAGRFQGQSDPPLNPAGRAQATALGEALGDRSVDAIWSSDLRRAQETAEILARALRRPVRLECRLREIHQGVWEGLGVEEIRARYEAGWTARSRDPIQAHAPGGESLMDVAVRVRLAGQDIADAHPSGRVLIVSHGLALATLLCLARDQPLARAYDLIPDNASVTEVVWPMASPT